MNPRTYTNRPRLRFITDDSDAGAGTSAVVEPVDEAAAEVVEPDPDAAPGEPVVEPAADADAKAPLDADAANAALAAVRTEAASYRTKLRDAEARLSTAKTVEEFEAATAELRQSNKDLETTLLRERAAHTHNLPEDLAALLKGETEEELTAHAKTLAKYATPAHVPGDLSGGLTPGEDTSLESLSSVELARKIRSAR